MGHKAEIYYYDIGDYLSREEKFKIIEEFGSMENLPFTWLNPNEHGDWISKRNDKFGTWIVLGDKDNKNNKNTFFVPYYSNGVKTNRDSWIINFFKKRLEKNVRQTIDFFNSESERYSNSDKSLSVESFINSDEKKISWSRAFRHDIEKAKQYTFDEKSYTFIHYRPYNKQILYFNRELVNDMALLPKLFGNGDVKNFVICVAGLGTSKGFEPLIVNCIPDLGLISACQCFPLYWYETATCKD